MEQNRREFIKGTAWMAALAAAGGSFSGCISLGGGASPMSNFAVAPLKKIRVGVIGVGSRGTGAVHRIALIPGCEIVALCDLLPEAVEKNVKWLKEKGRPVPKHLFSGKQDSWKALSDCDDVDLVYIVTPAPLHPPMEIYSLLAGKHVLTEVPGAQTIDQCWEIVETCEKVRRHCMMLENCCYGEMEMLAWNLCHKGLLGSLTHAEGGYIHNLTARHMEHPTAANNFRTRARKEQALARPGSQSKAWGNTYPTHALGPICLYMDMNRGDRMERIVSLSSAALAHNEFARAVYKPDEWQNKLDWATGDMNTSIIRTARGRTIMMQNDQCTPRPYSRINLIQGTKGCFYDYPLRVAFTDRPGDGAKTHKWFDEKRTEEIREQYKHPLWKSVGEIAKKVGGHGGMDFIMDLRWAYCLQNGLPLDMDVYDLASWSAIVPCSAKSDMAGGEPVAIPDFTRGAWATAKPQHIDDVDLKKMGFDPAAAQKDKSQLSV